MTGFPNLGRRAEQPSRLANIAITLAEVDSIGADAFCKCHAVIDDEGYARVRTDALQRLRYSCELLVIDAFHAELEGACKSRLERSLQALRKGAADLLRADEIELARLGFATSKVGRELVRKIVQSQAGTSLTDAS